MDPHGARPIGVHARGPVTSRTVPIETVDRVDVVLLDECGGCQQQLTHLASVKLLRKSDSSS